MHNIHILVTETATKKSMLWQNSWLGNAVIISVFVCFVLLQLKMQGFVGIYNVLGKKYLAENSEVFLHPSLF